MIEGNERGEGGKRRGKKEKGKRRSVEGEVERNKKIAFKKFFIILDLEL